MLILVIACVVLVLIAVWLFLCAPNSGRKRAAKYAGVKFAHRGLHSESCSENSIAAFKRACDAGHGIELDVQFSKDKELVVFHDDTTDRMTERSGKVCDATLEELKGLQLKNDGASIPTLAETLEAVSGRVPLLVEIKTCSNIRELTRATVDMLRKYNGDYIVESFNPFCIAELRKYAPEIIRGQLVTGRNDYKGLSGITAFLLSQLFLNVAARPDFIACNHKVSDTCGVWLNRRVFKAPCAAWTVTDADEVDRLSGEGIMPIFEKI